MSDKVVRATVEEDEEHCIQFAPVVKLYGGAFAPGDKVVVIPEAEYDRLKRLADRIARYAESIDKADYD